MCSSCRAQLPYSSTPPASSAYSVVPSPRCPLVGLELGRLACKEGCSSGRFCLGGARRQGAAGSLGLRSPVCSGLELVRLGVSAGCVWLSWGKVCLAWGDTAISNLFFALLHLPPLFPSSPSVCTACHSVVLGDTYNIPLDPRGKQCVPQPHSPLQSSVGKVPRGPVLRTHWGQGKGA